MYSLIFTCRFARPSLLQSMTDEALLQSLRENDKVRIDPETGRLTFMAPFPCNNITELLRILRKYPRGLRLKDLAESYPGAQEELEALSRTGGVESLWRARTVGNSADVGGVVFIRNEDREVGDLVLFRKPLLRYASLRAHARTHARGSFS
ncbi:hypothetical protein EON62_05830 [archaeon]|nr:MAG: hypothetical protein EON62_05830 [archaeon]